MFDYANAVPVYCNGHEWLSLPGENGATVAKPDAKPIGSSPDNPGKSCGDIKENAKNAPSGVYWINPNPSAHRDSFQVSDMVLYRVAAGIWLSWTDLL